MALCVWGQTGGIKMCSEAGNWRISEDPTSFFFPGVSDWYLPRCVQCAVVGTGSETQLFMFWDLAVFESCKDTKRKEGKFKLKIHSIVGFLSSVFLSLLFNTFNGNLGAIKGTWCCNSAKLLLSSWHCLTLLLDLWTLCGKQDVSLLSVLYDSCFLMSSSVMVQTVVINGP